MEKNDASEPTLLENGFYFKRPEFQGRLSEPTEHVIGLGALASRQVIELRTRTHHPDGRAENVAEHSHMLSRVATGMVRRFRDQLPADITEGEVSLFSDLHDDVEAYVRDTATDFITAQGLEEKEKRERAGARQLVAEYWDIDPVYCQRLAAYEAQRDPNARLVRLADKFMTLLIHIPNSGKIVRETYESREVFINSVLEHGERLRLQFPEFAWLVDYRDELGSYVADLAWPETA